MLFHQVEQWVNFTGTGITYDFTFPLSFANNLYLALYTHRNASSYNGFHRITNNQGNVDRSWYDQSYPKASLMNILAIGN